MASDMDKAIQENMKFTLELADKIPLSAATSVELRRFLSPYEARSCLLDRRCENFLTRKPAWTRSKNFKDRSMMRRTTLVHAS
jgi:hypothetical protein